MEHLIPIAWFEQQSTPVLLMILAMGIAVLVKGADGFVEGAVGLSEKLGIPKTIIGATIVSIGTTTPEAAVSVMAAFDGMPDFALGNAVGSVICDTGLIFGLCCLVSTLPKDRFVLNRHGWLQFASGVLLVLASLVFLNTETFTSIIPRWMGAVFVALLVGYMLVSIRWARQHRIAGTEEATDEEIEQAARSVLGNVVVLVIGLVLVLVSSRVSVADAQVLAERWNVPHSIIAATLIAFGTSLPELVTAITSLYKGHKELLIGNVIGADILNVLFVVGLSACAVPLQVSRLFFTLHFPVMIAILLLFRITALWRGTTFARWPGALFLGIHLCYVLLVLRYVTQH